MARTPALAATSTPSGYGKKPSLASTEPAARGPARWTASSTASTRLVERGGDDHFEERSNQRLGNGRVDRPVEGDDPAEGRSPIAVERAIEGLSRTLSEGHTAGVRVLDDGHRDIRKVRHERPGGLGVEQVVVGELESLPLPRAGDTAAGGGLVEGGRLMRILAVAEVAHLVAAEGEVLG